MEFWYYVMEGYDVKRVSYGIYKEFTGKKFRMPSGLNPRCI